MAGVSGRITTASVARASGCPVTFRKPPAPNPLSSATLAASRCPATGCPGPSLVRMAPAMTWLAWATGEPCRLVPAGANCCASWLSCCSVDGLVSKNLFWS